MTIVGDIWSLNKNKIMMNSKPNLKRSKEVPLFYAHNLSLKKKCALYVNS